MLSVGRSEVRSKQALQGKRREEAWTSRHSIRQCLLDAYSVQGLRPALRIQWGARLASSLLSWSSESSGRDRHYRTSCATNYVIISPLEKGNISGLWYLF